MQIRLKIKDWDSLTIQDCIRIIGFNVPAKLRELYQAKSNEAYIQRVEAFTEKDYIHFAKYYGKVLEVMVEDWGEIGDVKYMQWHERVTLYETYCANYVRSLFMSIEPIYEVKKLQSFKFEGEEYIIPESLEVLDNEIPGIKETALTFTEGAVLYDTLLELSENGIEKLPLFIAVYCRKKNEKYNERVTLERAEKFKELSMSIAWEVFFYIQRSLLVSWQNMMAFSMKGQEKVTHSTKAVLNILTSDSGSMK